MSFEGYYPAGSSELPIALTATRSRSSSVSSVRSNHSTTSGKDHTLLPSVNSHYNQHQLPQHNVQNTYQSSYQAPNPAIGLGLYTPDNQLNTNNDNSNNRLTGYSGSSDPNNLPINGFNQQQQQPSAHYQQSGHYSHQTQQRYYQCSHSRNRSNASETSLNIDTGISGNFPPGPTSLSSASSSRRGSFSDASNSISGGPHSSGFYSRKKSFRLSSTNGTAATNSDADDDLDMKLGNNCSNSPRRQRQRKLSKKPNSKDGILGSAQLDRVSGLLNGWDMLQPSGDPYEYEYVNNDDGMTENEKWKRRQMMRRGWESSRGQFIIISIVSMLAIFIRIWKLAIPAAVVSDEQHIGGYIREYLNGKFFLDVHPPLGKMLYALVAYLRKFDGKFDFVAGKLYTWSVPYISMRMLSAACGILLQ
ncbi:hypothetical protein BGZ76_007236 [Entomortierella beljakovae]|nr:hypothetical protein BGZ76_007236 [Entomortierella beljakovae]